MAVFNDDHTHVRIYNDETRTQSWRDGDVASVTMFPTDQIMLSRVLADRGGCYLHSGGVVLNGKGFLFVGHSEAGKSTTMKLLEGVGEVLCDDRNIVRREPGGGFRVYGTWSHGEVPIVSVGGRAAGRHPLPAAEQGEPHRPAASTAPPCAVSCMGTHHQAVRHRRLVG